MTRSVTTQSNAITNCELASSFAQAREYARMSRSDRTWRAYKSDWIQFDAWCQKVSLDALPATPETIAMFAASRAASGLCPSTIMRRLAAIRLVHLNAGFPSPHNTVQVSQVMQGIRRAWGKPPDRKSPAVDDLIKRMADAADSTTKSGLRDRAILLFGFAGAFRRSEIVALDTWNLEFQKEGVKVTITVSKTDQEAQGQSIAIVRHPKSPYCPVSALRNWLDAAHIEYGALFRRMYKNDKVGSTRLSPQSVAIIVKQYVRTIGLDARRYSGHSLRRGFLTSAARNRADVFKMADHSRHKSFEVLRQYVDLEDMFTNNAGDGLL